MFKIFEETQIKSMTLRNRIVRSATWENKATDEGFVTDELIDFTAELARGDVGLIITGISSVLEEGKIIFGQTGIHRDEFIPGLKRLTDEVHRYGGRVAVQLAHGGGKSRLLHPGKPLLAPSDLERAFFGTAPARAMTLEDIEFVHMNTAVESLNHIFRDSSPYLAEAQEYRLQLDYTPFIRDMVMEPGLKEVLDFLKPRCGLAVATNRSNTIGRVLEVNGLNHYFDIVVSSLDVAHPKPHPEPILKILDFFGIEPEQCFYVGDSAVDFEVCQAAGVPLIAYKNRSLKAPIHLESLLELKQILVKR